jgi:hypothetical protein
LFLFALQQRHADVKEFFCRACFQLFTQTQLASIDPELNSKIEVSVDIEGLETCQVCSMPCLYEPGDLSQDPTECQGREVIPGQREA